MLACFGYLCLCSLFFILVTCRECPHSSLCCVCALWNIICFCPFQKCCPKAVLYVLLSFFSPFPPILLYSLSPLWGLRLSAVCGVMHTDRNSHLLLSLLGGARGEIMTEKAIKSINKNSCPTDFVSFHRPRSASPFIHVGKRGSPAEGRCGRVWEQIHGNGRECWLLDEPCVCAGSDELCYSLLDTDRMLTSGIHGAGPCCTWLFPWVTSNLPRSSCSTRQMWPRRTHRDGRVRSNLGCQSFSSRCSVFLYGILVSNQSDTRLWLAFFQFCMRLSAQGIQRWSSWSCSIGTTSRPPWPLEEFPSYCRRLMR